MRASGTSLYSWYTANLLRCRHCVMLILNMWINEKKQTRAIRARKSLWWDKTKTKTVDDVSMNNCCIEFGPFISDWAASVGVVIIYASWNWSVETLTFKRKHENKFETETNFVVIFTALVLCFDRRDAYRWNLELNVSESKRIDRWTNDFWTKST